jgi:hypothetical protein
VGWGGVKTNFFTPPKGWVNLGWGDFASLPCTPFFIFVGGFMGAHLPKNDTKFDKKSAKIMIIRKNPKKSKILKLNRADQKLFFWH